LKTRIDGFPREVWINEAGDELIEAYSSRTVSTASGVFFIVSHSKVFQDCDASRRGREKHCEAAASAPPHFGAGEPVLEGEVLDKDDEPIWQQESMTPFPDIGAVINNALRAAGLIKG
jgi:hypothetical protein